MRTIPNEAESPNSYTYVAFRDTETLCAASVHGLNIRLEIMASVDKKEEKLLAHKTAVRGLSFSDDGEYLASFDTDTVTVWNTTTGTQVANWTGPEEMHNVAFSASNKLLAIVTEHGQVVIQNLTDSTSIELPSPFTHGVYKVAFDPSGRFLAASGVDRLACIWNLKTSSVAAEFPLPNSTHTLSFSPDGQLLVVGSTDIRLFDVESKELLLTFGAFTDLDARYESLVFSPDGDCLVAVSDCDQESILHIWDTTGGTRP